MRHSDRDLTPIVDHVARATYDRIREAATQAGTEVPTYDEIPAGDRTVLKQTVVPGVLLVLAALDAVDAAEQSTADADVLAAMESQFQAPDLP